MPKKGVLSREVIIEGVVIYKDKLIKDYGSGNTNCSNSDFTTDDDNDNILSCKKITITLSPEEWRVIEPIKIAYKRQNQARNYMTLPRGEWTHVIAEHFWEHTHLQCCLVFKRAKVYPIGEVYVTIVGRCKICNSNFKGTVRHKPSPNSRVLVDCKYVGNFYAPHDKNQKRRMTHAVKEIKLQKLLEQGKSSEFLREEEALRLRPTAH